MTYPIVPFVLLPCLYCHTYLQTLCYCVYQNISWFFERVHVLVYVVAAPFLTTSEKESYPVTQEVSCLEVD